MLVTCVGTIEEAYENRAVMPAVAFALKAKRAGCLVASMELEELRLTTAISRLG